MKKVKINFNEVKFFNLNDEQIIVKDFVKLAANAMYFSAPTIDLIDKARDLNNEKTVEVAEDELNFLIALFDPEHGKKVIVLFAQKALWEYLKAKLNGK